VKPTEVAPRLLADAEAGPGARAGATLEQPLGDQAVEGRAHLVEPSLDLPLEEPPLGDAFERVLAVGVSGEVGQDLALNLISI